MPPAPLYRADSESKKPLLLLGAAFRFGASSEAAFQGELPGHKAQALVEVNSAFIGGIGGDTDMFGAILLCPVQESLGQGCAHPLTAAGVSLRIKFTV